MGYHKLRVNNPWVKTESTVTVDLILYFFFLSVDRLSMTEVKFLRLRTSIALKYGLMIVDVPENL